MRQRILFLEYLGGKCVECGTTEDLQIDHIDPKTKSFNMSQYFSKARLSEAYAELDKCQILCHPHHIEKTVSEYKTGILTNKPFTHGTAYGYSIKGCRCEPCIEAYTIYNTKRNKKRRQDIPLKEAPHGSSRSYKRGCKCDECKAANTLFVRFRKENGYNLPSYERII